MEVKIKNWMQNPAVETLSENFEQMVKTWGIDDVLCGLAETAWYQRAEVSEKMLHVDSFRYIRKERQEKEPITIAAYYHSINNGGAQRVVASLCSLWAENPQYHVILITDEGPDEQDYPLSGKVQREYIPDYKSSTRADYRKRYFGWKRILDQNKIDYVVDSMWAASITLWDMLCIKGHQSKPAFILHTHNFCATSYQSTGDKALELLYDYQLCEGVITLSQCDYEYVNCFSNHTRYIVNPVCFSPEENLDSTMEKNSILWLGRIAEEKQPLEAIRMMSYIVKEVPDAKLYIVGDGNEALRKEMQEWIERLQLSEHVFLEGFTKEVDRYYGKASVFISTSSFEGFPLTFGEAMSYGIPVLSYDMPWLSLIRDGRGVLAVPQGRADLLAAEVIRLFKEPDLLKEMGRSGKEHITEIARTDIATEWKQFFAEVDDGEKSEKNISKNEKVILENMALFTNIGKNKISNSFEEKIKELKRKNSSLDREKKRYLSQIEETGNKLQKALEEKAELNKNLQTTCKEKNELNQKLQKTMAEKEKRDKKIEKLQAQAQKLKEQKETLERMLVVRIWKRLKRIFKRK